MSVKYEFDRSVADVYELLSDPGFLVKRSKDLGELRAECEVEDAGSTRKVSQKREIERELPSFLAKLYNSRQKIEMVEEWKPKGEGYTGKFTYDVVGQPVVIKGQFELQPTDTGCRYKVTHDVTVKIPLIGGRAAKFATTQAEESVLKELEYASDTLA